MGISINMDVIDAIKKRRSQRAFLDRPVEREKILAVLEAAAWAPSPANCQPWEFTVVTSRHVRGQLRNLAEAALAANRMEVRGFTYVKPVPESVRGEDSPVKRYSLGFLRQVPVIVAVSGLPGAAAPHDTREETTDSYKYACAAAIQNMMLAAEAMGLGSLWFTAYEQAAMRECLEIEASRHLLAMVCLGYPARPPEPSGRVPVEEKTRWIA